MIIAVMIIIAYFAYLFGLIVLIWLIYGNQVIVGSCVCSCKT